MWYKFSRIRQFQRTLLSSWGEKFFRTLVVNSAPVRWGFDSPKDSVADDPMILKVEPLVNSFVRLLHESIEKVPVNCLCSSAPPCFHKKRNVALLKTMLFCRHTIVKQRSLLVWRLIPYSINKKRICQTLFILHSLSKRKVLGARGKRKPKVSFSPCKSLLKKRTILIEKQPQKTKPVRPEIFS